MQTIKKIVLALFLSLLSVLAIGGSAANSYVQRDTDSTQGASVPTTGTRLSMYRAIPLGACSETDPNIAAGPTTFPANSAFFLRHGWLAFFDSLTGKEQGAFLNSNTNFELYIDGVEQHSLPDFFNSRGVQFKLFVFNFPDGMTGTHLFNGWWFIDDYLNGGTYGVKAFALACNLQVTFV